MGQEQRSGSVGRVAGIDFGRVRIGVALSDPGRRIASPYQTYQRRSPQEDARWFRRLVSDQEVRLFVVGLPVHTDGTESTLSRAAQRFGQWLQEVTGVPVVFFDERFSTQWADQALRQAGIRGKKRRQKVDKLAAQILLAAYLESGGRSAAVGPLEDT
jgi:putative Holliday junction resolvase